jgi:predicted membrane channel-forming protein YqfA (hemolysin III family)
MDGHTPATVQLTIATTATTTTTTAALHSNSSIMLATTLSSIGLFGMLFVGSLPKRRRLLGITLGITVIVMMISLVGCGGSSSKTPVTTTIPGTPAGSYAVTVTAKGTAGSYGGDTTDHPMAVTLTVQ